MDGKVQLQYSYVNNADDGTTIEYNEVLYENKCSKAITPKTAEEGNWLFDAGISVSSLIDSVGYEESLLERDTFQGRCSRDDKGQLLHPEYPEYCPILALRNE
jgi:antitoxin component YwqK of YwqJK toxin-antitoxin module